MSSADDFGDLETPETLSKSMDGGTPESLDESLIEFGRFAGEVMRRRRDDADTTLPVNIDKFVVVDLLGAGTYGRVYRVHDPDLHCYRAAKIPTDLVLANADLRGEFLSEARKLQKIDDHPNVVRVVQAGEDDGYGRPYFVMEYCRDQSLAFWLKNRQGKRADEKWAARLVSQIADGVHRIHQESLCHRDLKPGNILLVRVGEGADVDQPDFRPKVADLGLASVLDDPDVTTSLLQGPVGTPAYMAPEQCRGQRKEIGPASDVYGLGAILYEVVSGRRAYSSPSRSEIFESLKSDLPSPRLKEACPKASRAMRTVVETAMRKEPRYRYGSAAEMADDLKRLADGRPVYGAAWPRRALYFASKHRVAIASLVLLAAMGGVAIEYAKIAAERREAAASVWLRRMETALPSEVASLIRERNPSDPIVSKRLVAMFDSDEPTRKLNAALALAAVRPDCASYVVDRLLSLPQKDVGSIAQAVLPAVEDLVARLSAETIQPRPEAKGEPQHTPSLRRVNAALALFVLGEPKRGSLVLGDLGDPTARSLLVHSLGSAGVAPKDLVALTEDPSNAPPVRRQLLLAMGEIPGSTWSPTDLAHAQRLALSLYSDDPDPGVHGASKWLLKKWNRGDSIAKLDANLMSPEPRPEFGWRIDPSGLTFVVVEGSANGHRFEISDTEVPWRLYKEFAREAPGLIFDHELKAEEAALGMTFVQAASFTNWFSERAGLSPAFGASINNEQVPLASVVSRLPGYRLPTTSEFVLAAKAGTSTDCYFGDDPEMIRHYAFTVKTLNRPSVQAVGLLKPNDFGLFDMLGNALETCQFDGELPHGPNNQASYCGGSGIQSISKLKAGPDNGPRAVTTTFVPSGFRLVRTLRRVVATPAP